MLMPMRHFSVLAANHGRIGQPWNHCPRDVTVKELEDLTDLAEELEFDSIWTLDRVVVPEALDDGGPFHPRRAGIHQPGLGLVGRRHVEKRRFFQKIDVQRPAVALSPVMVLNRLGGVPSMAGRRSPLRPSCGSADSSAQL